MKYNFKIGDIVKLNPKEYNECYDEMPDWNTSDYYTIVNFDNEIDSNGDPVVVLNKSFYGNTVFTSFESRNKISSHFLLPEIKKLRKLKLKKIYESRR